MTLFPQLLQQQQEQQPLELENIAQFATKPSIVHETLAKDIYQAVDLKIRVLAKKENKKLKY